MNIFRCFSCCSAESYGLAAEAYGDALEGCKKTAKKVEEKFVAKMQEANVRKCTQRGERTESPLLNNTFGTKSPLRYRALLSTMLIVVLTSV